MGKQKTKHRNIVCLGEFVEYLLYLFFHSHNTKNYGGVEGKCRSLQELNSCCCSHIAIFLTCVLLKEKQKLLKKKGVVKVESSQQLLCLGKVFLEMHLASEIIWLEHRQYLCALEFQELKFYFTTSLIMPIGVLRIFTSTCAP